MKEKKGEHPVGDIGQLVLFVVFLALWVVDSFFLHISTFLSRHVPLCIRLVILPLALIAGAYLFRSGHAVAHRGQDASGVVSTGAFRYVRHPLYLACILFYLGVALSTASLFSLAFVVIIFLFYNYIASYEERFLEVKFSAEYTNYKNRTGKWVPRIGGRG